MGGVAPPIPGIIPPQAGRREPDPADRSHAVERADVVGEDAGPDHPCLRRRQVPPIHEGADQDPHFQTEQFKGWFEELNGEQYEPTIMPTYLEQWGYFGSTLVIETAQEALLGQRTAQDLADEWAAFLTEEYGKWKAAQ